MLHTRSDGVGQPLNREQRRSLKAAGLDVVISRELCQCCGLPVCPLCGTSVWLCLDCGYHTCDDCDVVVSPPVLA